MKRFSQQLQSISSSLRQIDAIDDALIASIENGLPMCPQPYAEIARQLHIEEQEVVERLASLKQRGIIKRLGVIVRHHELGYRANAMVVWNVPDERVAELGRCLSQYDFITLCYRRPRVLPQWPYNLFCMIHGKDRDQVLEKLDWLVETCRLQELEYQVLFSRRRFKQRGAVYRSAASQSARQQGENQYAT